MGRLEKRKLAQAGQAAMEKLDLPGEIALGVPRVELVGNREFYMDRHKGVLSYSTELVEIGGGSVELDTRELRGVLGEVPLDNYEVIKWIEDYLKEGYDSVS